MATDKSPTQGCTCWVYIKSEPTLWTVGFFDNENKWHTDSDHDSPELAGKRVRELNGVRDKYDQLKEENESLHKEVAEWKSLRCNINESFLHSFFPKKEMEYNDKVVLAIGKIEEDNKILKGLCNEMLGEFDRLRKTYDNVEDLAGIVSRTMYDKAITILSPFNTENNDTE